MNRMLDIIAELTKLRDRHELDSCFVELVRQHSGAESVVLWCMTKAGSEPQLRRRVPLPERRLPASADCLRCAELHEMVCSATVACGQVRLVLPVPYEGQVLAVLELTFAMPPTDELKADVETLARIFANQIALLDYAERDELTGLWNRRSFSSFLAQKRLEDEIVIAVADIDHFKRINDVFGHPYGDEVLILMARLMQACFGPDDGVFRFGGEEFLVIMTGISVHDAWVALEAFRSTVQAATFPQVGKVTISIGFSAVLPSDTGASAFGRADEALYVAKQRGRNQAQCYEALLEDGSVPGTKQIGGTVELF